VQETTSEETFLTVKDLAERHKVKIWTIYARNKRGTGPRYIQGHKAEGIRYRLSDVLAWEDARLRGGDA
jgi:hypothetical protein